MLKVISYIIKNMFKQVSGSSYSYLNNLLGESGLQPLEMLPVADEQLKDVTGDLSHRFVPKLDKRGKMARI